MRPKNIQSKSNKIFYVIIGLCIALGLGLMLYPTVADLWNQSRQTRAIGGYAEVVEETSDYEAAEMMAEAARFNQSLLDNETRFMMDDETLDWYRSILDVTGTGIMAYIEIPGINVKLPIYHGTDDTVLQIAAGHLEGTSFPVGGPGTHAAISAHSGHPSAKLFTNLGKMGLNDVFYIHVMGETFTYQVDQIGTVLPDEMDLLDIQEGQDYCTLITCTPYGINSHRLLVRGTRIETRELEAIQEIEGAAPIHDDEPMWLDDVSFPVAVIAAAVLTSLVIVVYLFFTKKLNDPRGGNRP